MDYFTGHEVGRTFVVQLKQGDYLLESIEELISKEKITDGVVVSGVGTLDYCVLHMVLTTGYPPEEHFEKWENRPLELASLNGIIAGGVPHLHAVISDHKMAYAGHLEKGCRILYLGEIVVVEFKSMNLTRVKNERGISLLTEKRQV